MALLFDANLYKHGRLIWTKLSVYLFSFTLIQINLKESLMNQLKCILWEVKIRTDRFHLHLFAIEKYLWFYICPPRSNRRYTVCDNLLWLTVTSKIKSKKYEIYTNFIQLLECVFRLKEKRITMGIYKSIHIVRKCKLSIALESQKREIWFIETWTIH